MTERGIKNKSSIKAINSHCVLTAQRLKKKICKSEDAIKCWFFVLCARLCCKNDDSDKALRSNRGTAE